MMFWMLSGVLVLHLSDGSLDYRTVKLDTCYNVEWAFMAENENPDARAVDEFVVEEGTYIIGATCIAPPELGEADDEWTP